jgi:hypothetical protein
MRTIEITADVGDGRPPGPHESAVPGRVCVLDGGVPWTRAKAELDPEWDRVNALATQIIDRRGTDGALDGREEFVIGVLAAARWTLSAVNAAPMTRQARPVNGEAIKSELSEAQRAMAARGRRWAGAAGVLHWLLWITGASEAMEYPGFDPHPSTRR